MLVGFGGFCGAAGLGEMRNKIRWGEAGGFLGFGRNNNGLKGLLIIRLAKITPFLGRRSVARARMRQSRARAAARRLIYSRQKRHSKSRNILAVLQELAEHATVDRVHRDVEGAK